MSLDLLLKPFKLADEKILKRYTRIGQHIPENHLYPIAMAANLVGVVAGPMVYFTDYLNWEVGSSLISSAVIGWSDFDLNTHGLQGRLKNESDGLIASDPFQELEIKYHRAIRLPVFATGASFVLKALYDLINSLSTGEPIQGDIYIDTRTGIGFILMASSMYLKDQNTKLLEKKKLKVLQPATKNS